MGRLDPVSSRYTSVNDSKPTCCSAASDSPLTRL